MTNSTNISDFISNLVDTELELEGRLDIQVGMAATRSSGSDSYPYTVTEITGKKGNRTITLRRDDHRPDGNHSFEYGGKQSYIYIPNPEGAEQYVQEKNWVHDNTYKVSFKNEATNRFRKGHGYIHFGTRRYYQDPSF